MTACGGRAAVTANWCAAPRQPPGGHQYGVRRRRSETVPGLFDVPAGGSRVAVCPSCCMPDAAELLPSRCSFEAGAVRQQWCRRVRVSQGVQLEDPGVGTCHNMSLQEQRSRSGHLHHLPVPFHHACTVNPLSEEGHKGGGHGRRYECEVKPSSLSSSRFKYSLFACHFLFLQILVSSIFLHLLFDSFSFLILFRQSTCVLSQRTHYKALS